MRLRRDRNRCCFGSAGCSLFQNMKLILLVCLAATTAAFLPPTGWGGYPSREISGGRRTTLTPPESRLPTLSMQTDPGLDALIRDLREAPNMEELTLKVSKSVKVVAQPVFFLRVAELVDTEKDPAERRKLEMLVEQVTEVLNRLVDFAEEKLDESSSLVNIVVSSAAEPDGEFLVPLSEERLSALRQSVKIHSDSIDNNFLATVNSYMEKCKSDGMEGMVTILQKVLQVYAAEALLRRGGGASGKTKTPAVLLLDQLLLTDPDKWDGIISSLADPGASKTGGITKDGIMGAIQVAIETVILQQENGSMAQRVQAEFLSELVNRIDAASPGV
ncbi:unnamed protein product [Discosporangium mesarthrocarpum]